MTTIKVYLETGKKKIFASALDWPGWSRSGRDEEQALQTLLDYGPRYVQVLTNGRMEFQPPQQLSQFLIIERLPGNSTTDFGAPAAVPGADSEAYGLDDFEFSKQLLQSCWSAFDNAIQTAAGTDLRRGPRGGGRDADKIITHVVDADLAYLARINWKQKVEKNVRASEQLNSVRQATLDALQRAAVEGLPDHGPRGGKIWPARYFLRRAAWHILDHAWEIEDRIV
jgi:hypothetical protein